MFAWTLLKIKRRKRLVSFQKRGEIHGKINKQEQEAQRPPLQTKQTKKNAQTEATTLTSHGSPTLTKKRKRKETRVKQKHNLSSNPRQWRNRRRRRHLAQTPPLTPCADCAISRARDQVALEGGESPLPNRPLGSPSDRALFPGGSHRPWLPWAFGAPCWAPPLKKQSPRQEKEDHCHPPQPCHPGVSSRIFHPLRGFGGASTSSSSGGPGTMPRDEERIVVGVTGGPRETVNGRGVRNQDPWNWPNDPRLASKPLAPTRAGRRLRGRNSSGPSPACIPVHSMKLLK
jgi:hypothetical protein